MRKVSHSSPRKECWLKASGLHRRPGNSYIPKSPSYLIISTSQEYKASLWIVSQWSCASLCSHSCYSGIKTWWAEASQSKCLGISNAAGTLSALSAICVAALCSMTMWGLWWTTHTIVVPCLHGDYPMFSQRWDCLVTHSSWNTCIPVVNHYVYVYV